MLEIKSVTSCVMYSWVCKAFLMCETRGSDIAPVSWSSLEGDKVEIRENVESSNKTAPCLPQKNSQPEYFDPIPFSSKWEAVFQLKRMMRIFAGCVSKAKVSEVQGEFFRPLQRTMGPWIEILAFWIPGQKLWHYYLYRKRLPFIPVQN